MGVCLVLGERFARLERRRQDVRPGANLLHAPAPERLAVRFRGQ